ncbi:MAG: glycoside hydrolase family 9 protein [Mariprofundaceae bacterium]|nr:glycoside hydrolase family 9 protein [Mariprofundaceae bacterium]
MLWNQHEYKPLKRGFSHYPYSWCYSYESDVFLNCTEGVPLKKESGPDQGSVLHLKGEHQTGGWRAAITLAGWVTGDIKRLLPSAQLILHAKAAHNTPIHIGISDRSFQRHEPLKLEAIWPKTLTLTPNWQTFSIPLAELSQLHPQWDTANTFTLFIENTPQDEANHFDIEISDIRITGREKEKVPIIRVNQHAYANHAKKQAVIQASIATSAQLIDVQTSEVALDKVLSQARYETASQEWVQTFDFSEVKQAGSYFVRVATHHSESFKITKRPMQQLAKDSLDFFYLQRAGIDISHERWHHKAAHLKKAQLLSNPSTHIDVSGGWYDAGDFGRYATTTALSTGVLLLLSEVGQHDAALQEAKVGLDWLIKMQAKDGGVYHKVASESGNKQQSSSGPEQNTHQLYVIDRMLGSTGSAKTTSDTALAAAVWATAARLWKRKNLVFSEKYKKSAFKAWAYLKKHPRMYPARGFYDPPNSHGGSYGPDISDYDERLWAAASLWHLTGQEKYQHAMSAQFNHVQAGIPHNKRHPWVEVDNFAIYATLMAEKDQQQSFSPYPAQLERYQKELQHRLDGSPHAWPLDKKDVVWASNSLLAYLALDLLMIDHLLKQNTAQEGARRIMDYLLGMNPMAYSYISGYGTRSVKKFFHSWFHHDGIDAVPSGFLAGGPNAEQGHWLSHAPLRCYRDEKSDWFSNEVAINWNAALAFVSHMLDHSDQRFASTGL